MTGAFQPVLAEATGCSALCFSEAGEKMECRLTSPFLKRQALLLFLKFVFTVYVNQACDFKELNLICNGMKKIYFEVFIIKDFGKSICDTEFFIAQVREQSK